MRPLLEEKVPSLVSGLHGDFKQGTSRDYLKYKTEDLEELMDFGDPAPPPRTETKTHTVPPPCTNRQEGPDPGNLNSSALTLFFALKFLPRMELWVEEEEE